MIKEEMERGELEKLPGQGRRIDLTPCFEIPEEVRLANSVLRESGMTSRKLDLLKEIADLQGVLAAVLDEKKAGDCEAAQAETGGIQPDDGAPETGAQAKVRFPVRHASKPRQNNLLCLYNAGLALQIIFSLLYFQMLTLTF
jgi:hypothetical protein